MCRWEGGRGRLRRNKLNLRRYEWMVVERSGGVCGLMDSWRVASSSAPAFNARELIVEPDRYECRREFAQNRRI